MKNQYFSVIKFPVFVSISLILLTALFFFFSVSGYASLGLSLVEKIIYGVIFGVILLLIITWLLVLSSTHRKIKNKILKTNLKWMMFHVYYFLAMVINLLFIQSRVSLWESFLNFNNEIVLTNHLGKKHKKVLLLLPHCLQNSKCQIRVTDDIMNCEECGKCVIAHLKKWANQESVHAAVASGGSIARKLIVEHKPEVIVAVACHRDLVEGTRDAWMLPVYAVLNERPHGPCFETTVSLANVEYAVQKFI